MSTTTTTAAKRRKLIIDTDCGGDDAVGIMTAAADPNVDIVMITAVWGNVGVEQGIENLGKLVDVLDRDIPLYMGAAGPMLGHDRETTQWYGFGEDGFGDADYKSSPRAAAAKKPGSKHAAVAIVEALSSISNSSAAQKGGGEQDDSIWQLICLGPLTNVAIALQLCPTLFKHLGSANGDVPGLVLMGGAMEGKGNSSLQAEFNFHCDPEAARCVFNNRSLPHPICVVTWELTVACALPWPLFDKLVGREQRRDSVRALSASGVYDHLDAALQQVPGEEGADAVLQQFLVKLLKKFEATSRPDVVELGDVERTQDTCVICDAVCVAIALQPQRCIRDRIKTYATVELHGEDTRGALCIDWYGTETSRLKKKRWVNADVVTKAHIDPVLDLIGKVTTRPVRKE